MKAGEEQQENAEQRMNNAGVATGTKTNGANKDTAGGSKRSEARQG